MRNAGRFYVCSALVFAVAACLTLAGAQETPTPQPEHAKLGFFVGKWTSEGTIHDNPMGMPPGTFSGKDDCKWFDGKFAVVCHSESDTPMGKVTGMGIMGYSSMQDVYTYYGTDSMGMAMTSVPAGKVDGKVWTYDDEMRMGDMSMKNRYTIEQTSDSSYTFKWEVEGPDGWTTVMEGTSKKR